MVSSNLGKLNAQRFAKYEPNAQTKHHSHRHLKLGLQRSLESFWVADVRHQPVPLLGLNANLGNWTSLCQPKHLQSIMHSKKWEIITRHNWDLISKASVARPVVGPLLANDHFLGHTQKRFIPHGCVYDKRIIIRELWRVCCWHKRIFPKQLK